MKSRHLFRAGVAVAFSSFLGAASLLAADWLPIDPADLAAEHSTIDPDAGAEILYHEKTVDDNFEEGSVTQEYFRVKVYNDKGVESLDKIDIPFARGTRISNLMARVVKADGTIVNVDRKAFYTRDVLRAGSERVRVKSFSFPGLEPGVIVEYRWDATKETGAGGFIALQDDMPTRKLRVRVRPYSYPGLYLNTIFHRCESQSLKQGDDGFFPIEMHDLAALKKEPYRPPPMEYQAWILFYFTLEHETPDAFWQRVGKEESSRLEKKVRPRKEVTAAVAPIVAGAKDDGEKLARIHDFCRSKIRNTTLESSGFTPDELEKLKKNNSASDTLERSYGTPEDIDILFVALARAAGFDARFVLSSNRDDTFFDRKVMARFALSDLIAAVKLGDTWRYFDPGATFVESGSLRWENEGVQALVLDAKKSMWVATPATSAAHSRTIRTAHLRIDETGTLEGDVRFQFRGHEAVAMKEDYDGKTPEEREDAIRTGVRNRLNGAEVSKIEVKNATDPLGPVSMSYHVRVPGYASATGQRLFFQPAYFQKGLDAEFTSSTRDYDVYFTFPWSEQDDIVIDFPAGFTLEEANSPAQLPKDGVINYEALVGVAKTGERMRYMRKFDFRPMLVGKANYRPLKETFDFIHQGDQHTLILKRAAVAPAAATPADPSATAKPEAAKEAAPAS